MKRSLLTCGDITFLVKRKAVKLASPHVIGRLTNCLNAKKQPDHCVFSRRVLSE